MNIEKLEQTIRELTGSYNAETFIYDLLLAYDLPKASITRLKKGTANLGKSDCDVLWKNRVCFSHDTSSDLHELVEQLKSSSRVKSAKPRFVIVTNGESLLACDMKNDDSLETPVDDLARHFDFFLPWAGMEKSQLKSESVADIRAAEKMGRLYDLILKSNPPKTDAERHSLNVFLARLLFCFFAEDTRIFVEGQFTNSIGSHTASDGSDLQPYLTRLFKVLAVEDRSGLPKYLADFPYVNGGLFCDEHPVPKFDAQSRKIILDCGGLNWRDINPDIFGSMIQAVVHTEERGNLGIHYTSVLNIMKVIEPLFLNDLRAELEKAGSNRKKLEALLERLYRIRVFDPACGSGNFLIIAYKELSKLEIEIFQRLHGDQRSFQFESKIQLTQFYGIEIDGFAAETAKLSLWLAEHQMNLSFEAVFGSARPTLPLHDGGHIRNGNATRIDWVDTCPDEDEVEVFVLGNPPYLSFNQRDKKHKEDMQIALAELGTVQRLDYIGCWFKKATDFIRGNHRKKYAFVTTNSLCQGEQVSLIWPYIFANDQEIFFAHSTFKWSNNARANAGVSCNVIGVRNVTAGKKYLYSQSSRREVSNISPYLVEGKNLIMSQCRESIVGLPEMALGSSGIDGGYLVLSSDEREKFIADDSRSKKFIRPYVGGGDLLDGTKRFCLWIEDMDVAEASSISMIKERIESCRNFRLEGGRDAKKGASIPHRFFYRKYCDKPAIVLPMTSSENRDYIPVAFLPEGVVPSNGVFVVYENDPFIFGILSSRMHLLWLMTLSGKLESRIRYSVNLNYNTFPLPHVSGRAKGIVEDAVFGVLDERERHPERTLAELYDSKAMPRGLRLAHQSLDIAIDECYRKKPFETDDDRLEHLFALYEQITEPK